MLLTNKRALVTGAGQGLGRAIAVRLADVGMDIALHCHNSTESAEEATEQITKRSRKALAVRADLRKHEQIEAMLDRVRADLGPIDVLINNASVFIATPLEELDSDVWRQIFEVNVFAPAQLISHIGLQMKARGAGRIVNIVDIAAERPFPSHSAYCASRAALVSLTKSLAKSLAPEVQVNAVAPGIIDWPDFMDEAERRGYLQRTPLGRTCAHDDVAAAVVYLVKEAAFVTGQVINVDGGRLL